MSPRLFKALGDPRRVSLLLRLAELRGERTVGEIAEGSDVDLSVVSRHLGILRDVGVIRCERRGKEVYCSIEASKVVSMLRQLADALEKCCGDGAKARGR